MLFILILLFLNVLPDGAWADYGFTTVAFFNEQKSVSSESVIEDDMAWLEDPSQRPPKAVMDLLEDPGPSTGKAYLKWQKRRIEKIRRAQEVLDRLEGEETGAGF